MVSNKKVEENRPSLKLSNVFRKQKLLAKQTIGNQGPDIDGNQEKEEASVELLRPLEKDIRIKSTHVFVLVKAPERCNQL